MFSLKVSSRDCINLSSYSNKTSITGIAPNEEGIVVGRAALTHLLERCQQKEDNIFKSLFSFHLIISRRLILRRCIQSMGKEIGNCKKILLYLDLLYFL